MSADIRTAFRFFEIFIQRSADAKGSSLVRSFRRLLRRSLNFEAHLDFKADPNSEAGLDFQADPDSEADSNFEAAPNSEVDLDSEAHLNFEAGLDFQADPDSEAGLDTGIGLESGTIDGDMKNSYF